MWRGGWPMPWSEANYAPAMEHLPPVVREKATEIANTLLSAECATSHTSPVYFGGLSV
jgi:uncharacterized protein YdaT